MTRSELEKRCQSGAKVVQLDEHRARCVALGNRPIVVDPHDKSLTPSLVQHGAWESWITVALMRATRKGDRFVDVGANVGWYCLAAAEAGAEVVAALEPGPRAADLLDETLRLNDLNAPVFRQAAWSKSGVTLNLEQDPSNLGGMSVCAERFPTVPTTSVTLDELAETHGPFDVIKIDVEGAEMEVWRGAKKARERKGVRVFMEFTPCAHADPLAALREIEADGFVVSAVDFSGNVTRADLEQIARHPEWVMLAIAKDARLFEGERVAPRKLRPGERQRILWYGDSPTGYTGFATVGRNVCHWLSKLWDVCYLGLGHDGEPHPFPYRIRQTNPKGRGDAFGFSRIEEVIELEEPDVILMNSDLYVVAQVLHDSKKWQKRPKIVAYCPVDSPGIKRKCAELLSDLDLFVSYTEFGLAEMRRAGFTGNAATIPHGIDRTLYKPHDKAEARKAIVPGVPADAFLIINVNRNQPRKRLDLTLMYFAEWINRGGDGYLYFHCAKKDAGWDLEELARQLGVGERVFIANAERPDDLPDESLLPLVYSAVDLYVTTTLGEGWGLPVLEAMACGLPVIAPDWSALGEWAKPAAKLVPCNALEVLHGYYTFGFGGVTAKEPFLAALDEMAGSKAVRDEYARRGRELASERRFQWEVVAEQFHFALRDVIGQPALREAAA